MLLNPTSYNYMKFKWYIYASRYDISTYDRVTYLLYSHSLFTNNRLIIVLLDQGFRLKYHRTREINYISTNRQILARVTYVYTHETKCTNNHGLG